MTIKEELIQIIDKMPEENITRVIELIKSNEYLDEAIDMESSGKLITKTIEELEEFEKWKLFLTRELGKNIFIGRAKIKIWLKRLTN